MSVLWECDEGCFVSHNEFISRVYDAKHRLHPLLFDVKRPYKESKSKPIFLDPLTSSIKKKFQRMIKSMTDDGVLPKIEENITDIVDPDKEHASAFVEECINQTLALREMNEIVGGNTSSSTACVKIEKCDVLVPKYSRFICGDVKNVLTKLEDATFDIVLLDPPWWNKYIRRKKKKDPTDSYKMLYNTEITALPINKHISKASLVAVWCTNCSNHISDIKELMFPAWNVKYVATWYWMKITRFGEPICRFEKNTGKQPFERIILGVRADSSVAKLPPDGRVVMSVPSMLHSHKPPLYDLLKPYCESEEPNCLEIFARYLLPHTTSVGFEPLRWQHLFLYTKENTDENEA